MDYKEKYEQLTKFIKDLYPFMSDYCKEKTEGMLPELKESEDERMWKLIKKYAHYNISDMALKADHITREQLETWLEKQGEQKSTWSEEDERLLKLSLENLAELKNCFGEKYGRVGECICWLKSIKQRMKGE